MKSHRSGEEIPDQKCVKDIRDATENYLNGTVIGITDKATGEYYRIINIYPSVDGLTMFLEIDTSEVTE